MAQPGVLYFVVGDRPAGPWSYTWRIWTHGTSFYLKPRSPVFSAMKISLHGPDDRPHIGRPGNKIEVDSDESGSIVTRRSPNWPDKGWFPGRPVADGVVHVLRLRFPWTLFRKNGPSGPFPGAIPCGRQGAFVRAPVSMRAIDLDVFVSNGRPYWPNEAQARADNACLGPLVNDAGQQLTAVSVLRSPFTHPAPPDLNPPRPRSDDCTRGIGAAPDPSGFVWFCEQWLSIDFLKKSP